MSCALPPEPARGEPLRASWGAQLVRWCRANTLVPTPGMVLSRTPNGMTYRPQAQPATAQPPSPPRTYPWQPFASVWTGTGDDPHAADRALRFRLVRGKFANATPLNTMDELLAFGDPTDAEIEEADAVVTQVYLQVPVSEATLGSGQIVYARGTIKIVEGTDLIEALGGDGSVPGFGATDGSVPAYLVVGLGEASWWGGALHFSSGYYSYLGCSTVVSGASPDGSTFGRSFVISSANPTPS